MIIHSKQKICLAAQPKAAIIVTALSSFDVATEDTTLTSQLSTEQNDGRSLREISTEKGTG
jgi:hypothetical protein